MTKDRVCGSAPLTGPDRETFADLFGRSRSESRPHNHGDCRLESQNDAANQISYEISRSVEVILAPKRSTLLWTNPLFRDFEQAGQHDGADLSGPEQELQRTIPINRQHHARQERDKRNERQEHKDYNID